VPAITVAMPAVSAAVPSVAAPIAGASIVAAAVPRACADEETAGEVARAVVSIGRASVRVIPVIAVGADGSWPNVARTDPHSHCDVLCINVRR
jgi:hypothetical protein